MPVLRWNEQASSYVDLVTGKPRDLFTVNVTKPTSVNTGPRQAPSSSVTGDVTLTSAQVYSKRTVNGRIIIPQSATGTIVIEDCIIDASAVSLSSQKSVIEVHPNTGAAVVIRFNEIIGQVGMIGIGTRRFTAYRNRIHHIEDAVRLHNYNGTGTALDVTFYANLCENLILVTPDPYNSRTDNKTHSDVIQIEGGDGARIYGNALIGMITTDGTSNVGWVQNDSPWLPVADGTAGASPHPQALSCLMITPSVSAVTNLYFAYNWCEGGEVGVNGGSSANNTTTGELTGNRFDRNQWRAGHTIDLDATATGIVTTDNVYMDDASPVTVRRNQ